MCWMQRVCALVVGLEPSRGCPGVLANCRLLPAFCPAFSVVHNVQRQTPSSTPNVEETQHEPFYKLCGRRKPLKVAGAGRKSVHLQDAGELKGGRAAGEHASAKGGELSERRMQIRPLKRKRQARADADEDALTSARANGAPGHSE